MSRLLEAWLEIRDNPGRTLLQAVGVVNDHLVSCFRWKEVQARARR